MLHHDKLVVMLKFNRYALALHMFPMIVIQATESNLLNCQRGNIVDYIIPGDPSQLYVL